MSRIAIIDAAIDNRYIGGKQIEFYDLCGDDLHDDANAVSHGTVCAAVLDFCAGDYELINIRMLGSSDSKVFGEIDLLAKALNLCMELKVDVVSLSAVSSILSDSKKLFNITRELSKQASIVSALDNRLFVTVPTSYPHVLGVRNDNLEALNPGGLAYRALDPFSANIFANCNFPFLREMRRHPSNSFAVPVVAAHINDLLNCGIAHDEIGTALQNLKEYPQNDGIDGFALSENSEDREIPVIFIEDGGNELCCEVMDELFSSHEVQSAALSFTEGAYDVRVRRIADTGSLAGALRFLERHYKTDIAFIIGKSGISEEIRKAIDIDVEVSFTSSGEAVLSYENTKEKTQRSNIAKRLHDILTADD